MSDTVNYCSCVHKGTLTWADGSKYVGQYKDNKRNGQVSTINKNIKDILI